MKKYIWVLVAGLISVTSLVCQDKVLLNNKPVISTDTSMLKMLRTYPKDTLKISKNQRYVLEAECWRDFMPKTDKNYQNGLITKLNFKNLADTAINYTVVLQKEYVVYKDSVWLSNIPLKKEKNGDFVTSGGPLWPTERTVDIILQVKIKGERYFISKRNVTIKRVE